MPRMQKRGKYSVSFSTGRETAYALEVIADSRATVRETLMNLPPGRISDARYCVALEVPAVFVLTAFFFLALVHDSPVYPL